MSRITTSTTGMMTCAVADRGVVGVDLGRRHAPDAVPSRARRRRSTRSCAHGLLRRVGVRGVRQRADAAAPCPPTTVGSVASGGSARISPSSTVSGRRSGESSDAIATRLDALGAVDRRPTVGDVVLGHDRRRPGCRSRAGKCSASTSWPSRASEYRQHEVARGHAVGLELERCRRRRQQHERGDDPDRTGVTRR